LATRCSVTICFTISGSSFRVSWRDYAASVSY
jgi:hypothetical protein